jgi:tetratricopeptide (TPR) repeat protein
MSVGSIDELRWLDALARRGRDAGLEVLAVDASGLDATSLKASLERYRRYNPEPSFPVAADADGALGRAFGPFEQLPQTVLLAPDGSIAYRDNGFSVGEGEIMAGKVERSFRLAGRPFPPADSAGATAVPPPVEEEAPSIRLRAEQDETFRGNVVDADTAYNAWEFDRALAGYLAALKVYPRDVHALSRVADIYLRRGDTAQALAFWERVLAADPAHAEAAARIRELRGR